MSELFKHVPALGLPGKLSILMVIGFHFSSWKSGVATWLTLASNMWVVGTHSTFRWCLNSECTIHHGPSFTSQQFWKQRWAEMELLPQPGSLTDCVSIPPADLTTVHIEINICDSEWMKLDGCLNGSKICHPEWYLEMWCCHAKNLGKC